MNPNEEIQLEILDDKWNVAESVFLDYDTDPAALNVKTGELRLKYSEAVKGACQNDEVFIE